MAGNLSEIVKLCIKSLQELIKDNKNELDSLQFRFLISSLRQFEKGIISLHIENNIELLKLLIDVLVSGLMPPDSEALLSTALCLLVRSTLNLDERCDLLVKCISANHALNVKLYCNSIYFIYSAIVQNIDLYRVCLSCSILECFDVNSLPNFYNPNSTCEENVPKSPFILIFDFLENSCMKFSILISFYFKLLVMWLGRLNDLFCHNFIDYSFLTVYLKKVIFIVNSNWENPIGGIREKNVEIMKLVFDILPKSNHLENSILNLSCILETSLLHLPWRMKCKYFILSAVLPKLGIKKVLNKYPYILHGLFFSLSRPHLVSAGTDVYREILNKIQVEDWLYFFLSPVKVLFFGRDRVAQQNLMSHWMPETLKAYPSVMSVLLTDLSTDTNSSSFLPLLALLKIGRRRGILEYVQIDHELVSVCLSHSDEEVRAEAFALICISTKTAVLPSQTEFNMVHTFLEENVNCDSTKIRQTILCSFKNFISRIKNSYLSMFGNSESSSKTSELDCKNEIEFIEWLKRFIINNNKPGANYQRRICSLNLLRMIFQQFSGKVAFKPKRLKCNNYNSQDTLFEKEIGESFKGSDMLSLLLRCLTDPAMDIRDTASYILMTNFKSPSEEIYIYLWKKILSKCVSSMFYEIECGAVLAEVFAHWSLCQPSIGLGGKDFPFFEVLLSQAEEQWVRLEENLLKGAMEGPVHGVLSALHRIISNPDVFMHLNIKELHVKRLLLLIDSLITFLIGVLSSKTFAVTNVAPSFAEMGEAIECITLKNVEGLVNVDKENLNSAYELVLNCIWLNLKMGCLVVSALATTFNKGNSEHLKEEDVERCAQLLIFVLMKCRHKGVIEAAGNALSLLTSFCSRSANCKLKEMPLKLLNDCLERVMGNEADSERTSITRSSAGLAILVHKLVAADVKNIAPVCVLKLLSWAEMNDMAALDNIETEDLPQTRALHFLKVIVQDAALFQYISAYMSDIASVCFKSFSSNIWAVRNAALQLFGPLVSKLVSQKKVQEDDIVGTNVTVEELNAHYPELVNLILRELKRSVENVTCELGLVSPTLLPILALCSRLSIGVPNLQSDSFKKQLLEFQSVFLILLSSPVIAVRKSSAKAMCAFTSLMQLPVRILLLIDSLMEKQSSSWNEVHGKLLCIKMLRDKLELDSYLIPALATKFKELQNLIKNMNFANSFEKMPVYIRVLFYELQGFTDQEISDLVAAINPRLCWHPGIALWSAVSVDLIILSCSEDSICHIIEKCSKCSYTMLESSVISLMKRIENDTLSALIKGDIMKLLIDLCDSNLPLNITICCLKLILQLSRELTVSISTVKLQKLFTKFIQSSECGMGCFAIALPLISCFVMRNAELKEQTDLAVKVAVIIKDRSSPKHAEEYRLGAGKALINFIPKFNQRSNLEENTEIVTCLLDSAILLLQDENTDVRMETARFVSILNKPKDVVFPQITFNPQSCIKSIFTNIFQLLPLKIALEFLWGKLVHEYSVGELENYIKPKTIRNPFAHEVDNVYAEYISITSMAADKLLTVVKKDLYDLSDFKNFLNKNKAKIIEEATAMISLLSSYELGEFHIQAEVYLTLVKIKYQVEITLTTRIEGFEKMVDIISKLEMGLINMHTIKTMTCLVKL